MDRDDPQSTRAPSLQHRLAQTDRPLLLDGATGTELERHGIACGLPLWSTHALLEAPSTVEAVHRAYLDAGAELITANTFRTQRRTLAREGLGQKDAELTQYAVEIAIRARTAAERPQSWIAGSLPPLEDCYRPDRVPDSASLEREHGHQAELLGESGVDLILIETMNSRREAEAAARAAARTGLPFTVSFVVWEAHEILSGEPLSDALLAVCDLGAEAVGINCVAPSIAAEVREALVRLGRPLLVSPNLGEPTAEGGFLPKPDTAPTDLAEMLAPWLRESALRIVGGCCGTGPREIAALAATLQADRGD